jgi:hypothetical protein
MIPSSKMGNSLDLLFVIINTIIVNLHYFTNANASMQSSPSITAFLLSQFYFAAVPPMPPVISRASRTRAVPLVPPAPAVPLHYSHHRLSSLPLLINKQDSVSTAAPADI